MDIKHITILILFFPMLLFSQQKWVEFLSYDGKFKVLAPGKLEENIDSLETPIGELAYHTFFYQNVAKSAENVMYMISYCDYPQGGMHSDSIDLVHEFFEATIEEAVAAVKGELRYATEMNDLGFPGSLWRIDYLDGKIIIKTKAFVVNNRYYAIQTISFKDKHLNKLQDKFLDSFKLL